MEHQDGWITDAQPVSAEALDRATGGGGKPSVLPLAISEAFRDTLSLLMTALVDDMIAQPSESELHASGPCASPPIESPGRLVSRYGSIERCGAGAGETRPHAGLDFSAPSGVPVLAVRPGVVAHIQYETDPDARASGYGTAVVIYHDDEDLVTVYSHLADVGVTTGAYVEAGQVIGVLGPVSTGQGLSLGVHLHFEVCCRGPNGESPFFWDPLRAHRADPEPWLRSHGIAFNRCGLLVSSKIP